MGPTLDELDRRLVGALHLAPRVTWDDLAAILAADASTLKRRFDRLSDAGLCRVIGQIGWGMHSAAMPVHLFVDISGETPLAVLDRLGALPHLQYLAQVSGDYPVYATVHAPSEQATSEVLDRVYAQPGVRRVITLPSLRTLRRGADWDPRLLTDRERRDLLVIAGPAIEDVATAVPPDRALSEAERTVMSMLQQDGRASAAGIARTAGLATSTAHRMVRRMLDEGWVKPRFEVVSEWLGFLTTFVLRLRVPPGSTTSVMRPLADLPQTRLIAHVAGDTSVLCMGLVADRTALAAFIDDELARIDGIDTVGIDVVLTERRRYWVDRDSEAGIGRFHAPPLLPAPA